MFKKAWKRLNQGTRIALISAGVGLPAATAVGFWFVFRESFELRAILDSLLTGLVMLAAYSVLVFFILVLYSQKERPKERPKEQP